MKSTLFHSAVPAVPARGIHLDLKGVTPTFTRLLELLQLFHQLKFQIVLVEWEDMFPWSCDPRMQSPDAYTETEILQFGKRCQQLGLKIIPLVQSLGHSENVLRLAGNEGLREIPSRTDVFHPLNPEAPALVARMVEDVLELLPDVTHFHLGADEVYTLGQNPASQAFVSEHGEAALYLRQLEPTLKVLESKGVRPMIWHDEIVQWEPAQIQLFSQRFDFVAWGYTGDPRDSSTYHYRLPHVEKLRNLGCTVWGATAYKGAEGPKANLPETHVREKATVGWVEVCSEHQLAGVFATGWSRYASGRIQVVPIDGALDSLVNTAAILYNGSLPQGGLAACLECLDELGEGEGFHRIQQILKRLTGLTDKAWSWLRELEEQAANISIEPQRANSGIEEIIFELLIADIDRITGCCRELEGALAGRVLAPLIVFYSRSRLQPIQRLTESLRHRLQLNEQYKLSSQPTICV